MATSCKKAKETAKDVKDTTENVAGKAVDGVKDVTKSVTDGAKDVATSVAEGTKNVVDKATNAVESAIAGVSIPEFADAKITEHVKIYANYAKKYIDAKGDVVKNASLAKEGVKLAKEGAELVKTMDAETKKKFNTVMNAIKSKMAPAK